MFDLDGTVYLDERAIPGAPEAIGRSARRVRAVAFLTNNPLERAATRMPRSCTRIGMPTAPGRGGHVARCAHRGTWRAHPPRAARAWRSPSRCWSGCWSRPGSRLTSTRPEDADVVVVSWDRAFDYAKLLAAFRAVRDGARIVATNPDPFCPTADGGACPTAPRCSRPSRPAPVPARRRSWASRRRTWRRPSCDRLGPARRRTCCMVGDRLLTDVRPGHARRA